MFGSRGFRGWVKIPEVLNPAFFRREAWRLSVWKSGLLSRNLDQGLGFRAV